MTDLPDFTREIVLLRLALTLPVDDEADRRVSREVNAYMAARGRRKIGRRATLTSSR